MDLESHARTLYKLGKTKDQILTELTLYTGSVAKAEAIFTEIENTENITEPFIAEISRFEPTNITADLSGLGCRGEGDFYIHHKIAELIGKRIGGALIGPEQQDDAGVVQLGDIYISVAVDGMHSRLSHFPFIAGFHVARAAIRDIIVMGCSPMALFSDIHLANDGDVAKVFDYISGITTVSELTDIPLISGSTLRIGGDLVLGDRLTGCAGCVGAGKQLTPRKNAKNGDVLIMTEGSGGGTIATTALYNGFSEVVNQTLNIRIINLGIKLLGSEFIKNIHAITDVTNGGIRGDAFEIANTADVRITILEDRFKALIQQDVKTMLTKLDIDPLGVSIDSLLIILPYENAAELLKYITDLGYDCNIVGFVTGTAESSNKGPGVQIIKDTQGVEIIKIINNIEEIENLETFDLKPEYRESPYTPIKKVVNVSVTDVSMIKDAIEQSMIKSLQKKEQVKAWIMQQGRL